MLKLAVFFLFSPLTCSPDLIPFKACGSWKKVCSVLRFIKELLFYKPGKFLKMKGPVLSLPVTDFAALLTAGDCTGLQIYVIMHIYTCQFIWWFVLLWKNYGEIFSALLCILPAFMRLSLFYNPLSVLFIVCLSLANSFKMGSHASLSIEVGKKQ